MPLNQLRVSSALPDTSLSNGATPDALAGKAGQQIVSDLHGKFYEQASRGNLWYLTTVVAGLAVPISTTTAPTVMLWNPAGSGKNAVLGRFNAAYVSGTSVATSIGLAYAANVGNVTATAAPITAFVQSAVGTNLFNGLFGSGYTSVMRSSAAGTNTVTAGTWFKTLAGESALIATTAMNPYVVDYDFQGECIIPPNVAIWVVGAAASGALLSQTLSWVEVPV